MYINAFFSVIFSMFFFAFALYAFMPQMFRRKTKKILKKMKINNLNKIL